MSRLDFKVQSRFKKRKRKEKKPDPSHPSLGPRSARSAPGNPNLSFSLTEGVSLCAPDTGRARGSAVPVTLTEDVREKSPVPSPRWFDFETRTGPDPNSDGDPGSCGSSGEVCGLHLNFSVIRRLFSCVQGSSAARVQISEFANVRKYVRGASGCALGCSSRRFWVPQRIKKPSE